MPQEYVISKFNTYSAKVRQTSRYLNGCCPICREGNSWNVKKRLFYFLNDDYLFCHNCNRSWFPYSWVKEVTNLSYKEIREELKDYDYDETYSLWVENETEKVFTLPVLPGECVNLKDELQLKYFSTNSVVNEVYKYCKSRRLFTAINSPKTFYCCLNDKFHGNRLIIPFYSDSGKIDCYISRSVLKTDSKAKYLMKFGSKKPIFNLDKVDENYPYIFIFEGQIDSMFVKNGVAISGVYLTDEQEQEIIQKFPFHKIVWVLDNYRFEEKDVVAVIVEKLENNQQVFLYEGEFSQYKDLNEYCTKKEQDYIDPALLLKGSYSGQKGLLKMD